MASNMNTQMQYKSAEQMQAQASPSSTEQVVRPAQRYFSLEIETDIDYVQHEHTGDCEAQQPKKERTILGMRGGGLIRT